jgi:hypothetical protein
VFSERTRSTRWCSTSSADEKPVGSHDARFAHRNLRSIHLTVAGNIKWGPYSWIRSCAKDVAHQLGYEVVSLTPLRLHPIQSHPKPLRTAETVVRGLCYLPKDGGQRREYSHNRRQSVKTFNIVVGVPAPGFTGPSNHRALCQLHVWGLVTQVQAPCPLL